MKLGPEILVPTHRHIIKTSIDKKTMRLFLDGKINWNDKKFKHLRNSLRISLRVQQSARCIYCRRLILIERKNACEDLEHYLDKSKPHYRRWTFSPVNITIACRPCNFVKSQKELGDFATQNSLQYSNNMGAFKWLHPYYDNYYENIEVKKGWIYQVRLTAPNIARAQKMIEDLQLNKVTIMHAYASEIKEKINRLTVLAGRSASKKNFERVSKLLEASLRIQNESWPDY